MFVQLLKPYRLSVCSCLCELPSVSTKIIWQSDITGSYNHGKTRPESPGSEITLSLFFFLFLFLYIYINGEHTALLKGQESQLQFIFY